MQMLGGRGQGGGNGPRGPSRATSESGPPPEMEYSAAEAGSFDAGPAEPPAKDLPF